MVRVLMVRIDCNSDEMERFEEVLESFKESVRVAFYRGDMTVDEIKVKE